MPKVSSLNAPPPSGTEQAIIDAFRGLAFERRYSAVRVIDIIERAGVGKSTFYEHFRGKDDVLLTAMQPILLALATAASGRAARSYVLSVVDHLWQQRSLARPLLDSTSAPVLQRRLAEIVKRHGGGLSSSEAAPLFAVGIAAAQLAMLRCWLAGRASATTDAITDQLIACSKLRSYGRLS